MTEQEKNEIQEGIYFGIIGLFDLPVLLYEDIANKFHSSFYKGYGKRLTTTLFTDPQYQKITDFIINLNEFSAGKLFNYVKDTQNEIFDKSGNVRPFNEFKKLATDVDELYNKTWLEVERENIISQAQSARDWQRFESEKGDLPYLRYITAGDERVRESHRALDSLTRPVNDTIWDSISIPNGWRCRCTIQQVGKEGKVTTDRQMNVRVEKENARIRKINKRKGKEVIPEIKSLSEIPNKLFRFNPAKEGYIYKIRGNNKHPFFKIEEEFNPLRDRNFNMDKNFGL